MIIVQERDRRIIKAIYDHRYLPTKDVERYIFKGLDSRRARERILELELAGLVRRERLDPFANRTILRLTRSGTALALEHRAAEIPQLRRVDVRTFLHDSLVISARFRLSEFWEAVWIPEGALKSEDYPQIPDGVMVFASGSQVAIEVENSSKGPKRFRELQERWRSVRALMILYIATAPNLYRLIQGYLKTGPQDLPFGLLLWSDLEMRQPKIWTARGEIDLLARRDL